jgi:hypothetical protein
MASRHTQRDHTGRFIPAPVPPADTSVDAVSGDPVGESDRPVGTVYARPVHDPRYGRVHRLIPTRQARVVDIRTGETASDYAPDVRAVLSRPGGRTTNHVVEFDGEPFMGETMPEDTLTVRRRTPLQPGIYRDANPGDRLRVPARSQTDEPPVPTETGIDNTRGLFR